MSRSRKPAVLRGFAAATLAIFTALVSHVVAGGAMPGPLGVIVPWILALMVCVLLAGKKLSFLRLGIGVSMSQVFFHTLFVLGSITPTATLGGHVHGAPLVLSTGDPLTTALVSTTSMWLGHALAALLTAAMLHRGERLLMGLRDLAMQAVRWLHQLVRTASFAAPVDAPLLRRARRADDEHLPSSPHLLALRRRGPPLSFTF